MDIFKEYGKKKDGAINESDDDEEQPLNEDEMSILKEFEDNDKELEEIALKICGALDDLKGNAENMKTLVKEQG